jgi:zinc transport system substrate-binding protein
MKKWQIVSILVVIFLIGFIYLIYLAFFPKQTPERESTSGIKVVTSFYPLYFFTKEIVGEKIDVINLTPAGAEPHDYEPNTADISQIEKSKLLIMNGLEFEPWGDKLRDQLDIREVKVLAVAEGLASLSIDEEGEMRIDPHVWLDPILAKQQVVKITNAITAIDPNNRDEYESNSQKLQDKLTVLDQDFRDGLANCRLRHVITSHTAFGYLAAEYGFIQTAISGVSPDEEPAPQRLGEVADLAKQLNIKYIFFETLISPRLAETIAQEVGAQTLVFNPLEGLTQAEQAAGKNYFTIQRSNLINLQTALECN